MKKLFPFDREGRILFILAIIFAGGIYFSRTIWDETILGAGRGLGFLLVGTLLIACLLSFLACAFIIRVFVYTFKKSAFPLFVLIVGVVTSALFPLPPGPAERSFTTHRDDFEDSVAMARRGDLEHGECFYAYSLPEEYQGLARECVSVQYDPALVVEFLLTNSHHPLVYVETQEALAASLFCNGMNSSIYKKLDEHWYLCTPGPD